MVKNAYNKALRLEGVCGQLILEGLQRCLAHSGLRELVPQVDGSCEHFCNTSCLSKQLTDVCLSSTLFLGQQIKRKRLVNVLFLCVSL